MRGNMNEYIDKGSTYEEYLTMIDDLLAAGRTTGPVQSEGMVEYGRMNRHRMRRLERTVLLTEDVKRAAVDLTRAADRGARVGRLRSR